MHLPEIYAEEGLRLQVHTLLKGLEKIATSADIPMIVAGDFNSTPGSAAHDLLTQRSVRPDHKVGGISGLLCSLVYFRYESTLLSEFSFWQAGQI